MEITPSAEDYGGTIPKIKIGIVAHGCSSRGERGQADPPSLGSRNGRMRPSPHFLRLHSSTRAVLLQVACTESASRSGSRAL
jgi:hypothetical protein